MGIFHESETDKTKVSPARSHVRTARRSWPLSARLLVGAMLVSNILLAAFLLRTEMKRPGAPAISAPLPLHPPNTRSTPRLNTPPDQQPSLDQESKTPPVEARSAASPSTQVAKRRQIQSLRATQSPRAVLPAPMPQAVISSPLEPLGRTPAPDRNPAASSSASANVAPAGRPASFGTLGAGVPGNSAPHPHAPAAPSLAPSAIDHGLAAKGTRSDSGTKVASVGLPAMERGLVTPKMPVAPISHKIEFVPRPPVVLENCGDDKVFIACPTLKIRYDTPYTSEAP